MMLTKTTVSKIIDNHDLFFIYFFSVCLRFSARQKGQPKVFLSRLFFGAPNSNALVRIVDVGLLRSMNGTQNFVFDWAHNLLLLYGYVISDFLLLSNPRHPQNFCGLLKYNQKPLLALSLQ